MIDVTGGCIVGVERGPGWLFVRLSDVSRSEEREPLLAEGILALLQQHFVNRVVLECDGLRQLSHAQVEQLARLREWIDEQEGLMRLSGLTSESVATIEHCGHARLLPNYASRENAIRASRPTQPR